MSRYILGHKNITTDYCQSRDMTKLGMKYDDYSAKAKFIDIIASWQRITRQTLYIQSTT